MKDKVDFLKFFEGEANRAKSEPAKEKETDAGGKLFETIETFVQRFAKGQNKEIGFKTIDKMKELFNPVLSENEKKALSAVITYLKAKKMK